MSALSTPIQLLFRTGGYKVGSIKFDLILDEAHNFSNQVSSHSVEDGSVISDHIKNNLENGTLTGFVTNFTIGRVTALSSFFTNRVQEAFDNLHELWKERTTVTIVTIMRVYENVAITNITIPKNALGGSSLSALISFEQMNVVKLVTVPIDVSVKQKAMKTARAKQAAPPVEVAETIPFEPLGEPVDNITKWTQRR